MFVLYPFLFVSLALIAFISCLVVRRFRRYALQALLAPLAFGVCAVLGLVASLFAKAAWANPLASREHPVSIDVHLGTFSYDGMFFYLCGGICGAWLAVRLVNSIHREKFPIK